MGLFKILLQGMILISGSPIRNLSLAELTTSAVASKADSRCPLTSFPQQHVIVHGVPPISNSISRTPRACLWETPPRGSRKGSAGHRCGDSTECGLQGAWQQHLLLGHTPHPHDGVGQSPGPGRKPGDTNLTGARKPGYPAVSAAAQ